MSTFQYVNVNSPPAPPFFTLATALLRSLSSILQLMLSPRLAPLILLTIYVKCGLNLPSFRLLLLPF